MIKKDLKGQVRNYFNDPNSELGLGIINGEVVPDKFVKTYTLDLKDIKTLELFSDGYFVLLDDAEIESWEKAFLAGEKEDPLRWNRYPAVKGVMPGRYSDDRTILIVNFA